MKLDTCAGKLFSSLGLSSDCSGGKAAGRPSACSWKICSGRPPSVSRCRPRSSSHTPAGSEPPSSPAAAADTTTCPPCATAVIRAAPRTSTPASPAAVRDASPQSMPIRTRTLPAGHSWATSARCTPIAAPAHARGEANTAENSSPRRPASSPPCTAKPARISRR